VKRGTARGAQIEPAQGLAATLKPINAAIFTSTSISLSCFCLLLLADRSAWI
jgi:hypothetical protein